MLEGQCCCCSLKIVHEPLLHSIEPGLLIRQPTVIFKPSCCQAVHKVLTGKASSARAARQFYWSSPAVEEQEKANLWCCHSDVFFFFFPPKYIFIISKDFIFLTFVETFPFFFMLTLVSFDPALMLCWNLCSDWPVEVVTECLSCDSEFFSV